MISLAVSHIASFENPSPSAPQSFPTLTLSLLCRFTYLHIAVLTLSTSIWNLEVLIKGYFQMLAFMNSYRPRAPDVTREVTGPVRRPDGTIFCIEDTTTSYKSREGFH